MVYEIKSTKEDYKDLKSGMKNFQIVPGDLNCKIGDILHIKEIEIKDKVRETGNSIVRRIKYISDKSDFRILGFECPECWDIHSY